MFLKNDRLRLPDTGRRNGHTVDLVSIRLDLRAYCLFKIAWCRFLDLCLDADVANDLLFYLLNLFSFLNKLHAGTCELGAVSRLHHEITTTITRV